MGGSAGGSSPWEEEEEEVEEELEEEVEEEDEEEVDDARDCAAGRGRRSARDWPQLLQRRNGVAISTAVCGARIQLPGLFLGRGECIRCWSMMRRMAAVERLYDSAISTVPDASLYGLCTVWTGMYHLLHHHTAFSLAGIAG